MWLCGARGRRTDCFLIQRATACKRFYPTLCHRLEDGLDHRLRPMGYNSIQ